MGKILPLDKITAKIAALGTLGLILIVAIHATGLAGAAAVTAALAAIGPGGMIGGIITLGFGVLVADAIAKYGFNAIFTGVVKELYKRGETKDTIRDKIEKYYISEELKLKLKKTLEDLPE